MSVSVASICLFRKRPIAGLADDSLWFRVPTPWRATSGAGLALRQRLRRFSFVLAQPPLALQGLGHGLSQGVEGTLAFVLELVEGHHVTRRDELPHRSR